MSGNLVDLTAIPGGLDNVRDADPGALLGIALVATGVQAGAVTITAELGSVIPSTTLTVN